MKKPIEPHCEWCGEKFETRNKGQRFCSRRCKFRAKGIYEEKGKLADHKFRLAIFARDGFRCVYCGDTSNETKLEIDHVFPKIAGGESKPENLVTSCIACNRSKADNIFHSEIFQIIWDRAFQRSKTKGFSQLYQRWTASKPHS